MRTKYIVRKIDNGKNLPIWYYGKGNLVEIVHFNRKIIIKPTDYIRIVDEFGKRRQGLKAIKVVESLGLSNDNDLYEHNDKVHFDFFGEFDFIYINLQNRAEESLFNDEVPTYTEAIKYAQSIIKKDSFWIDTAKPISKVTTIGANSNWVKYVIMEETFVPPKRKNE